MSTIRLLWTLSALAAMAAGLVLGIGVATLYSARWLSGMTPALGLLLLQACQVALGLAGARSGDARHLGLTTASGMGLGLGYSAVAVLLPSVTSQWIFLVPAAALVLALVSSVALLSGQLLARHRQFGRSSQDR
jgi:hypothetical protein